MKIDEIRSLKNTANKLRGIIPTYAEKIKDSSCDKHALQFGGDDRFSVFKATVFLDCHTGYYGNSSCSSLTRIDNEIAQSLLNKALNRHMDLILKTMAEFAEKAAANLIEGAEKEIAAMQELINSAKQ